MMYVKLLADLVQVVVPLIVQILRAMKDREVRQIGEELRGAKTPEQKRDAARKITDYLYRN
jgi:hypothetical protein